MLHNVVQQSTHLVQIGPISHGILIKVDALFRSFDQKDVQYHFATNILISSLKYLCDCFGVWGGVVKRDIQAIQLGNWATLAFFRL